MTINKKLPEVHHCIASLNAETGGPAVSVSRLCDNLLDYGIKPIIHSIDLGTDFGPPVVPVRKEIPLFTSGCIASKKLRIMIPIGFRKKLIKRIASAALIHSHGIWLTVNHLSAVVAKEKGLPHIVSPRGMLEGWSLEHKALKKKIAWFLYQQKDLADAYVFCATSLKEAESIRNLGFKQPIAVIPNGVDLPDLASDIETKKEVYNLLFFSRLNPKKGVLDLIEAWHRLKETNIFKGNSWKLKIVGPDEQGYKKIIVGTIKKYHIEDDITIADAVYGKEKFKLFNQSDIFILPTYSENFGNVIVEALAAGVPVITTKGAPWSELVTNRCGWWTEIGTEGCYDALRMAITTTAMERREMGQRGRRLVETMYSWPTVAMKTAKFYQWILHGGAKPEFIY